MTGGIVVILGRTGINFGAGMTGGLAFVYDPQREFIDNMNQELIEALRIDTDDTELERIYLKNLLKQKIRLSKKNFLKAIHLKFGQCLEVIFLFVSKMEKH